VTTPPTHRILIDPDGVRWHVGECRVPAAEAARLQQAFGWRTKGWLRFRSERGEERLLPLPPLWHAITDEALAALLSAARQSPAA
jgi:hypothetical protein